MIWAIMYIDPNTGGILFQILLVVFIAIIILMVVLRNLVKARKRNKSSIQNVAHFNNPIPTVQAGSAKVVATSSALSVDQQEKLNQAMQPHPASNAIFFRRLASRSSKYSIK